MSGSVGDTWGPAIVRNSSSSSSSDDNDNDDDDCVSDRPSDVAGRPSENGSCYSSPRALSGSL